MYVVLIFAISEYFLNLSVLIFRKQVLLPKEHREFLKPRVTILPYLTTNLPQLIVK